jgi:hypothetical protein
VTTSSGRCPRQRSGPGERAMNDSLPINRPMRRNEILQDAPGTIFSRGWRLWYPLFFDHASAHRRSSPCTVIGKISNGGRRCGRCRPCGRKERAHKGLGKLPKPQFSTAPTPITVSYKRKRNNGERCRCANQIVSMEGFTPCWCARQCVQTRSEIHQAAPNANQRTNEERA